MHPDIFIEKNFDFLKNMKSNPNTSISPFINLNSGDIIEVKFFDHFNYLSANFAWIDEELKHLSQELDDAHFDFAANLDPDEHPCWHTYEIWEGYRELEVKQDILLKLALEQKIYRVGFYKNSIDLFGYVFNEDDDDVLFFKQLASLLEIDVKVKKKRVKSNSKIKRS